MEAGGLCQQNADNVSASRDKWPYWLRPLVHAAEDPFSGKDNIQRYLCIFRFKGMG